MELKQKTIDEKIKAIKNYLEKEDTDDLEMALNVFNLIKRGNAFGNSFFEHESIIFNNILEFVNIKNKLTPELTKFCKKLVVIFYNCIQRCNDFEKKQETKPIPLIYRHALYQADFLTMSQIAMEYGVEDFTNEIYENGLDILASMSDKMSIFNKFTLNFSEEEINNGDTGKSNINV